MPAYPHRHSGTSVTVLTVDASYHSGFGGWGAVIHRPTARPDIHKEGRLKGLVCSTDAELRGVLAGLRAYLDEIDAPKTPMLLIQNDNFHVLSLLNYFGGGQQFATQLRFPEYDRPSGSLPHRQLAGEVGALCQARGLELWLRHVKSRRNKFNIICDQLARRNMEAQLEEIDGVAAKHAGYDQATQRREARAILAPDPVVATDGSRRPI